MLSRRFRSRKIAAILGTALCLFALSAQNAMALDTLQLTSPADQTEATLVRAKMGQYSGKPKIGLALGGGGARGAAHVGVLKVLAREGIKFDCVVGTSIGAIVGGFYCLGAKPEEMEAPFIKCEVMRHFMTVPLTLRLAAAPILYMPRLLGARPYDGLYGGKRFNHYLMAGMSTKDQHIENLPITFAAVSFNLLDGRPYLIRKGNLALAMTASSAVPSLRKPVEIEGQLMADGGVIANLPVKQCRELGADFVIAVDIDQPFKKEERDFFRKPGSITQRMITWGLYDMDRAQAMMADIVIHPDTDGISLISTKKSDAKRALIAGEKAAEAILPLLREKLGKLKTAQSAGSE